MNERIPELAEKYKYMLSGNDPATTGRTPQHITLLFAEENYAALSDLDLDQQLELVRLAGADLGWWRSV